VFLGYLMNLNRFLHGHWALIIRKTYLLLNVCEITLSRLYNTRHIG
jgi:hypothetical protein